MVRGDNDGLGNLEELRVYHTTPLDPDTDDDDLPDGEEIEIGTSPLNRDTDGDSIFDGIEYFQYGTSPLLNDTDADGLSDSQEIGIFHTNATNPDTDGDRLTDYQEVIVYHTDPIDPDMDDDGVDDYDEVVTHQTNPEDQDTDQDGLTDYFEIMMSLTLPTNNDTDGDTLSDGLEYKVYHTDPNSSDTDGDGLSDAYEISVNLNPLSTDTDGDSISDNVDFDPYVHVGYYVTALFVGIVGMAIVVVKLRRKMAVKEYVTEAEPASPGLEPGMEVVVEYKIRSGKVVFGVVVRNGSNTVMQNVHVVLGIPDLTDTIKSELMGTIEPGNSAVAEIEFELEPGAVGELVGMVEYDSPEGDHRVVNLRPVRIVA